MREEEAASGDHVLASSASLLENVAGREQMGLGVFMTAMQFYGQCKQQGELEEVRVYLAGDGNLARPPSTTYWSPVAG